MARDGPTTVVANEGFQVPCNCAPKLVFPQAEVPVYNVFASIQQDLGSLDSVVVHSSVGSDPILAPITSVVATQVCQSQQVGRSEDSLIDAPVHSSKVGARLVSSESPSSILDVSAGAIV